MTMLPALKEGLKIKMVSCRVAGQEREQSWYSGRSQLRKEYSGVAGWWAGGAGGCIWGVGLGRERLRRVLNPKLTLDFVLGINCLHTWSPLFK